MRLPLALLVALPALAGGLPEGPEPGASDAWLARAERSLAAREYEASESESGLQAPNRAHDLRTWFGATGIRVHDRTAPGSPELLALWVAGVGRGETLVPLAAGEVASQGPRVEIRRAGLVEWYLNSPAGLEQGFTLGERPAGEGPLVLELALSGAAAALRGDAIELASATGRRLRYGGLEAADAEGRALPARLEVPAPGRLRLVVEDAGAAYPVVIDPLLTETADAQLEANQADATFGQSVASAGDVNGDGFADVIVGAPDYDIGPNTGAAFVFLGSASGIGTTPATLTSDQPSSRFGLSVASAGDVNGDRYADVIVGAGAYYDVETGEGWAFIFHGSASGIASAAASGAATKLQGNQGSASFGWSVAGAGDVNGDGYADVIVGAWRYDSGEGIGEGAAFVFHGSASGLPNEGAAEADAQIEADQGNTALGMSVASAGDVNGDGFADVIVGAVNFDSGETDEGVALIFHGSASGVGNGDPANADTKLEADQASAAFGISVASAGDVNGDGYADAIVGANSYTADLSDEGAAFVFHGSVSGIPSGSAGSADSRLESNQTFSAFGVSVASAGDVDGDGYADVIVGANNYDGGQSGEGAAFLFRGSATGVVDIGDPSNAAAQLEGNQVDVNLGFSAVSAGDVNGDGYADVIAGAYGYDSGESDEGVAFVYLGGAEGVRDGSPATAAATLEANQAGAAMGVGVAGAGDVNGDGYADAIVGAYCYSTPEVCEGAAFVFQGSASGIADGAPASADAQLKDPNQASADMGWSVAGAGDVNGDGYADVIVGAYRYDAGQLDEGAAFLFLGSASGIASGSAATAAARLEGDQADARMGWSVASAGDVNGDGYADVIIGAPQYDAGELEEGAAFLFLGSASGIASGGPASAEARLEGDQASALLGQSVAGAGDVNGDGYADVIVGAGAYDAPQSSEGAAFVFLGSATGIATGGPASAAAQLEGDQVGATLGESVASAGDVNGDGYADVIVGAFRYDAGQGALEGAAFVFLGSATGIADGSPASAAARLEGDQASARMGQGVASAGDVNGDGYADVIVGASTYDAGQADEGAAFVFLGSATGIADGSPASAAAQLESDQTGPQPGDQNDDPRMGFSVASAGDVNGDGYADVIVGAYRYEAGQSDEGAAFVFLGNGDGDGRPVLARQLRGGSSTPVAPWGSSADPDTFRVSLRATHPQGRGRVKLEVEACAAGAPFGHASCTTHVSASWTDATATPGGVTLTETVSGLAPGTLYRWRARVLQAPLSVTQPGIISPPKPAHSPWRRLSGQALEADIASDVDDDLDGVGDFLDNCLGLSNPGQDNLDGDGLGDACDPDLDGDGLSNAAETGTYGTSPTDADSDDDGLGDGAEVALGTDPLDPDSDGDLICDGNATVGGVCSPGPAGADNCPLIPSAEVGEQANSDSLPAGDLCQCGDVTGEGVVSALDLQVVREHVVGATLSAPLDPTRCSVIGTGDGCDVADAYLLDRLLRGQAVGVGSGCSAFVGP